MGKRLDTGALPKVGKPAERALAAAGVNSLADVVGCSRAELAALHGMGPKALAALETALAERGLGFKED